MSDNDHTDGDLPNWRCNFYNNRRESALQWVLESDEYNGIAILMLPWKSDWYKERNPEWEKEWNQEVARVQAAADLIQAAPFMLDALLKAQAGDMSAVEEAIERATGKLDWLGEPMELTNAQSRAPNH